MNKSEWGFFIAGSIGLAMMLMVCLGAALAYLGMEAGIEALAAFSFAFSIVVSYIAISSESKQRRAREEMLREMEDANAR